MRIDWGRAELKGLVSGLALAVALMVTVTALTVVTASASALACLPPSVQVVGAVPNTVDLDDEQRANARTIVEAVVARRLPSRAAVVAVATALQESSLRNIPYGDRDSLGLFQQRPSTGWGPARRIMDPLRSTNAFLDRLTDVPDWPLLPLTVVAQRVQISAYPDAYAKWESTATQVVAGLLGRPTTSDTGRGAVDTPGLLALGAIDLGSVLPSTFQGGAVGAEFRPGLTFAQVSARLRRDRLRLPNTLLINAMPAPGSPVAAQMKAVLDLAGPDRTVYVLTRPGQILEAVGLRVLAAFDPRLHVIDLAGAVLQHPAWSDGTGLSDAGREGLRQLLDQRLGLTPDPQPASDPACADGLGGYSAVPVPDCGFILARPNARECRDAIRWALARIDGPAVWYQRCLNFVARAYGWNASGVQNAALFWVTATERHTDPEPPAGALVFWDTGHRDGHVALSAGNGLVISNDIGGDGTIAAVSLTTITTRWHATYLGWTPPLFGHGV